MLRERLVSDLGKVINILWDVDFVPSLELSSDLGFGDYTSNVALVLGKRLGKAPMEIAEKIASHLRSRNLKLDFIEKIDVVKPGFVNFWLSRDCLMERALELADNKRFDIRSSIVGKKILVEYGHPNTHKELHIGHLRTLVLGEAIARMSEACGATVFRANYQGDIGPHVAKALYGVKARLDEGGLVIVELENWTNEERAHFLGEAYARGSRDYDTHSDEIDKINKSLYDGKSEFGELYELTRKWSLNYFADFYRRLGVSYDKLFFESETAALGKKLVVDNVGGVFEKADEGAIVFKGEKYGLHTRVFVTKNGYPTYEGKEMGNAFMEQEAFDFDEKVHVVANEQTGYFKVVFKALELLDPVKFEGKQKHIQMGLVQLTEGKMSSRTGEVLTVDWLIGAVKEKARELMKGDDARLDEILEKVAVGAIKYSLLKVDAVKNVIFDIKKSVALDGNSGVYLQYTYARTRSVLNKARDLKIEKQRVTSDLEFDRDEENMIRLLVRFEEIISASAGRYSSHILCNYLFEVAQGFNVFYQKCPILKAGVDVRDFRLSLTEACGNVLKRGLGLLGIEVMERM